MVHRHPLAGLLVLLKERELRDPEEVEFALRDELELAGKVISERAEHRQRHGILVGDNQHDIALLRACLFADCSELALFEELAEGAGGLCINPADVCKTLCADALDHLDQLVDLLAGERLGSVLRGDAADRAAVSERICKDRELRSLHSLREIGDLHAKAQIGLIGAKAVHRFGVGEARQRSLQLLAHHITEKAHKEAFGNIENVIDIDKGHFEVDLREFRLTVRTEILVAEAACELDVAVIARDHQELLVDLRRLRQRIEFAVMHTGGDEIVSCALRRRFHHHRGLDFEEAVFIEILPCAHRDLVAQNEILLERCSAEVEIAVFQAQLLIDLRLRGDLEGRGLCLCENAQLGDMNLDMTRCDLVRFALALTHLALCQQHIFALAGRRLLKEGAVGRVVEGELHNARAVSQHDENDTALVAHGIDKAADCDGLARFQHLAAVAGALHSLHVVHSQKSPLKNSFAIKLIRECRI